jgi:hypothetical protein
MWFLSTVRILAYSTQFITIWSIFIFKSHTRLNRGLDPNNTNPIIEMGSEIELNNHVRWNLLMLKLTSTKNRNFFCSAIMYEYVWSYRNFVKANQVYLFSECSFTLLSSQRCLMLSAVNLICNSFHFVISKWIERSCMGKECLLKYEDAEKYEEIIFRGSSRINVEA